MLTLFRSSFILLCFAATMLHATQPMQIKNYYVYLAGKVRKDGEEKNMPDWRADYTQNLKRRDVILLTPEYPAENNSKPNHVFGRDCKLIKDADLVVVDGSIKMGAGTSMEILIAKYFNKHVMIVLPKDCHHRKSKQYLYAKEIHDWINPFLSETVDSVVSSHQEAIAKLQNIESLLQIKIKNLQLIDQSIADFFTATKENVLQTAAM